MVLAAIVRRLPHWWYSQRLHPVLWPLLPLSWLFRVLVGLRRWLFGLGVLRSSRLSVPVVVVGNLTVGGSGKTPLVLWLADQLSAAGWQPGIISRGYGRESDEVLEVTGDSDPAVAGDEPKLLARRSRVPVFVGRDRFAAGQRLLARYPACNVIISDDGLQHYRLQRSFEIAVFDGRAFGNAQVLPAGPLREPLSRLSAVDAIVWNSDCSPPSLGKAAVDMLPQFAMRLSGQRFVSLSDPLRTCTADDLRGARLYAIAGIGDPSRFFRQLDALGLTFEARPFSDHHAYTAGDLAFAADGILLMTEKDAVKCAALTECEAWLLPVDADLLVASNGHALLDILLEKLNGRPPA